jgi:hypothetical protein
MCLGSRLYDARAPLAPAHARALLRLVYLQVLAAAVTLAVLQLQVSSHRRRAPPVFARAWFSPSLTTRCFVLFLQLALAVKAFVQPLT